MVIRHLKAEDQAVFLAFCQDFYSGGAVLHAVDPDNFRRTFEACVSGNPYTEGVPAGSGRTAGGIYPGIPYLEQ